MIFRNQKKEELKDAMRKLAYYINQIAQGDPGHILASGFDLPLSTDSSGIPVPHIISCKTEIDSKTIWVRAAPWRSARVHHFQFRRSGSEEPWQSVIAFRPNHAFTGLEQFAFYDFRVKYVGIFVFYDFPEVILFLQQAFSL